MTNPHLSNEDILGMLPAVDWNEMLRAAQEAAAAPPGPVRLPEPTMPYGLRHPAAGTVRWSCKLGCGWSHDENPGADVSSMRIVLPADFTGRDIGDALSAQAAERHEAMLQRVEAALAEHYASAHPARQSDDRT